MYRLLREIEFLENTGCLDFVQNAYDRHVTKQFIQNFDISRREWYYGSNVTIEFSSFTNRIFEIIFRSLKNKILRTGATQKAVDHLDTPLYAWLKHAFYPISQTFSIILQQSSRILFVSVITNFSAIFI